MQCNLAFDSSRGLGSVQEEINDMCIFEKYMSEEDFKQLLKKKNIVVSSIFPEMTATGRSKSTNCFSTPEVYSTVAPNLSCSAFLNERCALNEQSSSSTQLAAEHAQKAFLLPW